MFFNKRPKYTLLFLVFISMFVISVFRTLVSCNETEEMASDQAYFHEILGMEETCMGCHDNYTGFAANHNPQAIGCSPCHGGHPREPDETRAHADMVLVPGNLSNVRFTCGAANCHGDITGRVENSLMNTMAGVVNVNRFVFGASDTLSAPAHVQDLRLDHAADVHLRQLCASCHLGNEKAKAARVSETSRGGGCIACHLDYTEVPSEPGRQTSAEKIIHPAVNLKVTNAHCFGCHSRSGRISTNYEGWHETTLEAETHAGRPGYRLLDDGRIFQKIQADVHHELGLECIDCHSAKELMGDGQVYLHEEDAVKIRCADCHFSKPQATATYEGLDLESKKILQLRGADYLDAPFVRGTENGEPILNVIVDANDQAVMVAKNSGKHYPLSPPADICTRGSAHDALSCSACHTGWAPQCVGCHNTFEPKEIAFDHLDKKRMQGKWVEYIGEFFAEAPSLGVVDQEHIRQIKTFIPGMIMTIDKSNFPGEEHSPETFHRLFAPTAAHTTTKKGRDCESCHNNPLALGYGRGELKFETQGKAGRWRFTSEYQNSPQDGWPQDAWTGFLRFPEGISGTRPGARPFTTLEQQKILTVGTCLTCHKGGSEVMLRSLDGFELTLKEKSASCIIPVWDHE